MPEPNTILQGRYRIIRQLGRGGMGSVFEAIDERVSRSIVLKKASFDTAERIENFKREAQLLANLHHPALPRVSDHFVEGNGQYLVMDFVPGNDLAELLRLLGRPFPLTDVLRWADELLRVLEYLHKYSPPILHRDIKPANLKLTRDGEIFLLDFGLAKGAAGQMPTIFQGASSIPGYTPNYSPLEQILRADNQSFDPINIDFLSSLNPKEVERIVQCETGVGSDLYSLGTTLYHLLTNELPSNSVRRASYIWKGQPDPMRPAHEINPLIPSEISNVLASATALLVEQRPPSAAAMRAALRDLSLSMRLPAGQIALSQLSQEAVESIVQLTLERLAEKPLAETVQHKENLAVHERNIKALDHQFAQLANDVREYANQRRSLSLAEIEPNAIDSIARQVTEQFAKQEALAALVKSLVKKELTQHQAMVEASDKPKSTVAAAIEAGKKAYQEEKSKAESPDAARGDNRGRNSLSDDLPVRVRNEEERRLHDDARRFARLLVSEIAHYNEAQLIEGRQRSDIYDRLYEYIDRSREMFLRRAGPSISSQYDYFHHELIKTLAEGDVSKMGANYPGELDLGKW